MAVALAAPEPAAAITNGVPAPLRTDVGATVMQSFDWPAERGGPTFQMQQCSGVLVAPRVFLTAAHCTDFFWYSRSFRRFGVTFASESPFGPFDPAADGLVHGRVVQDPEYPTQCPVTTCETADPHDLAAVVLDAPVPGPVASLPPERLLDDLAARNGLRDAAFTVAGYGSTGTIRAAGAPPATPAAASGGRPRRRTWRSRPRSCACRRTRRAATAAPATATRARRSSWAGRAPSWD